MSTLASSKQLDSLFPAMDPTTRIAVIGAGPSGLSAALALSRLGYTNITVLEQNAKVGGMCGSELIEGHVYDMGGQVIARESSPTLDTLMAEMGMELEPLGEQPFSKLHFASGRYEDMKIVSDVFSMLKITEKLREDGKASERLGVHAVSSMVHETAQNYLKKMKESKFNPKGLVEVPKAVAALFTASGYGYAEHMPYAYMHEFVMSCLGQPWRVKGGYDSFWRKIAARLPDVRCDMKVETIQRCNNKIHISAADRSHNTQSDDSTYISAPRKLLEFDKLIISGSASVPRNCRIYLSKHSNALSPASKASGILDYTAKELEVFSKVEIVDYYTTVLKISGFEHFPPRFYYPDYADDPSSVGRFVAMQRFHADTNVFLFWSYGTAEIDQNRVKELLFEDVQKMGGRVEALVLQRKFCYYPHVNSQDMAMGFYDKLQGLQGENNTYYVGALMAFELTERNASYSINLMARCFGSTDEPIYVKRLIEYPLPNGAEEPETYEIRELTELPGIEFPDLPFIDAYLSFYAEHPVTRDKVLYTWIDDQGKESNKLTFSQLNTRATTIALHLLTCKLNLKPGDRVVLLHPPGLEFIEAFLGCLRAKILAVPLIPPDPSKKGGDLALEKLRNVVKIVDAKAILTTRTYYSVVRASSLSVMGNGPKWPELPWIQSNCLSADDSIITAWLPKGLKGIPSAPVIAGASENEKGILDLNSLPDRDSVCFLQFTSGSTGDAKGVMITHGALIHNTKSMRAAYRSTTSTVCISWLPQYHDMGLIGSLLVGLVSGGHVVKFSPLTFIRKPIMWLTLIDKYRATHTAAPNFGFDLVLKRYEALRALGREPKLDLSSLNFLMVGAEPINSQTMRGFVETFWDSGIREQIFAPGFGLAENCVFICCAYGRNQPIRVDSQGRVACGYIKSGDPTHKDICADVRLVDPMTLKEVAEGMEGEIWIGSSSNGKGYWGMDDLSKETFYALLNSPIPGDAQRTFVRSGDLGRNIQGNLFVTGRIKDLIIVGGRNYYPPDIERTVENCSNLLRPGCSAAFSINSRVLRSKGVIMPDDSEGIVVVAEVRDENEAQSDLVSKIKASVAEVHGLQVSFVNLIKPRTIPKTTSGKIRRHECAKRFAEGILASVRTANVSGAKSRLRRGTHTVQNTPPKLSRQELLNYNESVKGKKEISDFLVSLVTELSGTPLSEVSLTESFENYSIDSQGAVSAAFKLSEFIGTHISAIQIYTTGCISELADLAVEVIKKSKAASGAYNMNHEPRIPQLSEGTTAVLKQDLNRLDSVEGELTEEQLADALEPSRKRKLCITALQMMGLLYIAFMLFSPAIYIYKYILQTTIPANISKFHNVLQTASLVPLAWIVYTASVGLLVSTFGVRTLLPVNHKSQTMMIPLWSPQYVRWWTLYRMQDFASSKLGSQLKGTALLGLWYRLLGAEIEDGVYLDTTDITDPWLVSIGRDSAIAEGVTIQSHEVDAGVVRFESISIGKACAIGPYSFIQRGSALEAGSNVGALANVTVGEYAQAKGATQVSSKGSSFTSTSSFEVVVNQVIGLYFVGVLSTLAALAAYYVLEGSGGYFDIFDDARSKALGKEASNHGYLLLALALTFPRYLTIMGPLMVFPNQLGLLFEILKYVATPKKCLAVLTSFGAAYMAYGVTLTALTCIIKWTLVGRVKEGTSSQYSYRTWFVHALLRSTHEKFVTLLQGTEALCIYLRMLGADIGDRASIRRTNALIDPDLIKLGNDCHLGDFCKIITAEHLPGGAVSTAAISIGDLCVVGAQSVVMPGSTLQDRVVLGALAVAPRGATLETDGVYVGAPTPVKVKGSQSTQKNEKLKPFAKMEAQTGTPESIISFNDNPLGFNMDPRFRQIVASCAGEFARNTPAGHHRIIHHLGGSGKGVLRVLQNASNLPPHDILKPGSTYPVVLRCSTSNSKDDDRHADVRGATMRLLDPNHPDDIEKPLLDLFMKTGPIFHVQNMVDFMGYYIMSEEERAQKIKEFPPLGEAQWLNLRRPNSWADLHYYCCTCRYFVTNPKEGAPEVFYVKFKLRPSDPTIGDELGNVQRDGNMPPMNGMLPVLPDDTRPKTCLRDELKRRLQSPQGVKFTLQMQLHTIPACVEEQEKVQDPSSVWDETAYPFVDVAELWLTEHVDDRVFDKTHFNPRFGPPSLAMITATSATQSGSIDTGRALIHDLLTYIRSGMQLPPLWYDLLRKSHADLLTGRPDTVASGLGNGYPLSGGGGVPEDKRQTNNSDNLDEDAVKLNAHLHDVLENRTSKKDAAPRENAPSTLDGLKLMRLLQPILQVEFPLVFSLLATYPLLLTLSWVGSSVGMEWVYWLVPVEFVCWGLLFAALAIMCKWGTVWRIRDGTTNELWSLPTFLLTVWECINQTVGSSFMELGKGSVLATLYLRYLGASIKTTGVYIDTLHALNPDQLKIGYRSAIGRNALLFGHLYEGQQVGFKSNFVQDDTFIGSRALILPGCRMKDGAELLALGLGMKDEIIKAAYSS